MKEKGEENEHMHKEMVEKEMWVKKLFYNIIIHQNTFKNVLKKFMVFKCLSFKSILTKMPYKRLLISELDLDGCATLKIVLLKSKCFNNKLSFCKYCEKNTLENVI